MNIDHGSDAMLQTTVDIVERDFPASTTAASRPHDLASLLHQTVLPQVLRILTSNEGHSEQGAEYTLMARNQSCLLD